MSEDGERRSTERYENEPLVEINVIPVITVALIMLLILTMMLPVMNIPNMPIRLPVAITIETKEKNIAVSYNKEGQLALNADIVAWEKFPALLQAELKKKGDIMVIIRADKEAPYGAVENLIQLIKKNGAKKIAVGTEQKKIIADD